VEQGSDSYDQYVFESGTGYRQLGSLWFRECNRVATVRIIVFYRVQQGSDS